MTRRLEGRTAVVVGAGWSAEDIGNGAAAAVTYERHGARVLCADRSEAAARRTADFIRAEGGEAVACVADVTVKDDLARMKDAALGAWGRIHILHNNVGIEEISPLEELSEESWDRVMAVNLKGAVLACQQVIPHMAQAGGGTVVNISSIASLRWSPIPYLSYNVSKAGLNHFTRLMARQYAPQQVRVNTVVPGLIDTPHAAALAPGDADAQARARDKRTARCPMGRQGTPWDVAGAALFLVSDEAAYVTGVELLVDGGLTL